MEVTPVIKRTGVNSWLTAGAQATWGPINFGPRRGVRSHRAAQTSWHVLWLQPQRACTISPHDNWVFNANKITMSWNSSPPTLPIHARTRPPTHIHPRICALNPSSTERAWPSNDTSNITRPHDTTARHDRTTRPHDTTARGNQSGGSARA
jgi:hypothetical protein